MKQYSNLLALYLLISFFYVDFSCASERQKDDLLGEAKHYESLITEEITQRITDNNKRIDHNKIDNCRIAAVAAYT